MRCSFIVSEVGRPGTPLASGCAPSLRTVLSFAAAVSASSNRGLGVVASPPSRPSQEVRLLGVRLPEGGDDSPTFPDG